MKLYLKSPVYFEIEVPDGTNRSQVTDLFRKELEVNFRKLIKTIRLSDDDLESFRNLFGPVKIRLLTELQVASKSLTGSKLPDFLEY